MSTFIPTAEKVLGKSNSSSNTGNTRITIKKVNQLRSCKYTVGNSFINICIFNSSECMRLVKTLLLFLVLKIKDRHLLHKFKFQQQPGRLVVPSREEVNIVLDPLFHNVQSWKIRVRTRNVKPQVNFRGDKAFSCTQKTSILKNYIVN